jgi:hypothetical protein
MKLVTTLLLAAVALLTVGVLGAPEAGAAPKPAKTAKFKAQIKGEQTITWSYNRAPEAPCYGGENAGGSARMFFESDKPAKLTAYEIRKDNPLWESTYQRVMFAAAAPFQTFANATLEGTHASGPVPQPDMCEDNGGGVTPQPEDCATATALIDVSLAYVNKDRLLVRGDASSWDPGFAELRNLFSNCPWWQGGPYGHEQAEGDLTPVDVKLKERKLFDAKGPKKVVLNGSTTDCYEDEGLSVCGLEDGPFRGKIITSWKLILKRVR